MSKDKIQKADKQDLSLVVRAIGTDLEHTQVRVIASANADMLFHYWKVGHFILYLQKKEGWGSKVIDNLSKAIRSKYPDKKGYSTRNLIYMCQFAKAYPMEVLTEMGKVEELLNSPSVDNVLQLTNELNQFTQQPVALIQNSDIQGRYNYATACCEIARSIRNFVGYLPQRHQSVRRSLQAISHRSHQLGKPRNSA